MALANEMSTESKGSSQSSGLEGYGLGEAEEHELSNAFDSLDLDGSGTIDMQELAAVLRCAARHLRVQNRPRKLVKHAPRHREWSPVHKAL